MIPCRIYNTMVSTLYHACKSSKAIDQYIRDASQAGNNEAAQFFQMVAQQDQQRAQRAQELLNQLSGGSGSTTTEEFLIRTTFLAAA